MAIPNFRSFMLPLLKLSADGNTHSLREAVQSLALEFQLSDAEISETLPSGRSTTIYNRIAWAATYLRKAGLLNSSGRGQFQITKLGLDVLANPPKRFDDEFLGQYEGFVEFRARRDDEEEEIVTEKLEAQTPEEAIEAAYQNLRQSLVDEVLQTVKNCSPAFFERLVIDVLVKMGYGGTRKDAGKAVGKSGDGGIDGIINEDRLGLDVIYIQAKKWEGSVGRPELQKFAGALQGRRAKKGIFITTSTFTNEAKDYVSQIDSKITLIDGETLSQLMIDYNVGINPIATYELKRIDNDYFIEE
jgi:restriction system protein